MILLISISIAKLLYYVDPQRILKKISFSTIIYDRHNKLMGAKISKDGQWRFPFDISNKQFNKENHIPYKFEKAILLFEDEFFYYHIGFNPVSIIKALFKNIKKQKKFSGASTISLQISRLLRNYALKSNKIIRKNKRNIFDKVLELIIALWLEIRYSKKQILNLYCNLAPFGSNVVGLRTASWRYFHRSPEKLSWAEIAALAVLPNAPSLIYPGKNSIKFVKKRNFLLKKLASRNIIDNITLKLALQEPLPHKPKPLPNHAYHLLQRIIKEGYTGTQFRSTIDLSLQIKSKNILNRHFKILKENMIYNIAILIVEIDTKNVLAYHGNTNIESKKFDYGQYVDIITHKRSSGSILKPFLYAFLLREGIILPNSLVFDIPTSISGYSPKNSDDQFYGAISASKALYKSLNVPFVRLLYSYGLEKFYFELKELDILSLEKPPLYYGLSLILGGAEISLWQAVSAYVNLARLLLKDNKNNLIQSKQNKIKKLNFDYNKKEFGRNIDQLEKIYKRKIPKAIVWATFEALTNMPDDRNFNKN